MCDRIVDIVMATHDGERYVAEQIESILWQDFEDWRLLVSDDRSADGTTAVVRSYAARDPRVTTVSEGREYGSAVANFMNLLALSEAPYVMFCDQDDVWLPEKISATLARMRELEEGEGAGVPLVVFTDMAVVDEDLRVIAPSFERYSGFDPRRVAFPQLISLNVAAGCTVMMNRPAALRCREAREPDRIVMHDWWAMLVASALGKVGYLDVATNLYRQHGRNAVGTKGYSPLRRAMDPSFMEEQFRATMRQAAYFLETYGDGLGTDDMDAIREYVAIGSSDTVAGGGGTSAQERLHEAGRAEDGPGRHGAADGPCEEVYAGIVTYNPDPSRLLENVESIAGQVAKVLIFDNASENVEELERVVRRNPSIEVMRNGINGGMAVALNAIARRFRDHGATHVVFLDQDSVAGEGMVKELRRHCGEGVGIVCPLVQDRNVERVEVDPSATYEVRRPVTSGSMVSLAAWSVVGGYDERLFVDWVDNEFCDNLRVHGYRIVRTHGARILHEMGDQEYAFRGPGVDYANNRDMRRGYYRQNYPAWRWRDRARSEFITMRKYGWSRIGVEEAAIFIKSTLGRVILLERSKLQCLRAVAGGAIDGWRAGGLPTAAPHESEEE